MNKHLKEIIIVLSLANVSFLGQWSVLLKPSNIYYMRTNSAPIELIALMLSVTSLAAVCWCGVKVYRLTKWKLAMLAATLCFSGALLLPFVNLLRVGTIHMGALFAEHTWLTPMGMIFAWAIIAICALRWRRVTVGAAKTILLILAPFVVITFSRATWLFVSLQVRPTFDTARVEEGVKKTIPATRVLWIIFDEMDERIAFAERPDELALPEFDKLRSESLYATNARSPSGGTLTSIPALLMGKQVSKASALNDHELSVTLEETGESVRFSEQENIFKEVFESGGNTAVVGQWHNPYCRLFGVYITSCLKEITEQVTVRKANAKEIPKIMAKQIWTLQIFLSRLPDSWAWAKSTFDFESERHIESFTKALENTKRFAEDETLAFVFAHFPVPHAPYIYDRSKNEFSSANYGPSGYLDNLALADRTLGELRSVMEQAGTWERTALIVSSDHHWRGSKRFDGKIYERWVPFILKLPGQKRGETYEKEFNTFLTHGLVLEILDGGIKEYEEAIRWLDDER